MHHLRARASDHQRTRLTHALEVMRRGLVTGAAPAEVRRSLFALALFAIVLTVAGVASFIWALRRARIDGSLSHY